MSRFLLLLWLSLFVLPASAETDESYEEMLQRLKREGQITRATTLEDQTRASNPPPQKRPTARSFTPHQASPTSTQTETSSIPEPSVTEEEANINQELVDGYNELFDLAYEMEQNPLGLEDSEKESSSFSMGYDFFGVTSLLGELIDTSEKTGWEKVVWWVLISLCTIGSLIAFSGYIWMVVRGFQVSVAWGIFNLLGITLVFFLIIEWEMASSPFKLTAIGTGVQVFMIAIAGILWPLKNDADIIREEKAQWEAEQKEWIDEHRRENHNLAPIEVPAL